VGSCPGGKTSRRKTGNIHGSACTIYLHGNLMMGARICTGKEKPKGTWGTREVGRGIGRELKRPESWERVFFRTQVNTEKSYRDSETWDLVEKLEREYIWKEGGETQGGIPGWCIKGQCLGKKARRTLSFPSLLPSCSETWDTRRCANQERQRGLMRTGDETNRLVLKARRPQQTGVVTGSGWVGEKEKKWRKRGLRKQKGSERTWEKKSLGPLKRRGNQNGLFPL